MIACAVPLWALCTISAFSLTSLDTAPQRGAVAAALSPAPRPTPPPVKLPATEGAWLVVVTRSGGFVGPYFMMYSINSTGEGSTPRADGSGRRMISPDLLAQVEKQVHAAQSQAWASSSDTQCCDLVRTSIDLSVRQTGGLVISFSVGWTLLPPGSPNNANALVHAVVSALMDVPAGR
jgi:hypothetical protein